MFLVLDLGLLILIFKLFVCLILLSFSSYFTEHFVNFDCDLCLGIWVNSMRLDESGFFQREFSLVSLRCCPGNISLWQGHFKLNSQLEVLKMYFLGTYVTWCKLWMQTQASASRCSLSSGEIQLLSYSKWRALTGKFRCSFLKAEVHLFLVHPNSGGISLCDLNFMEELSIGFPILSNSQEVVKTWIELIWPIYAWWKTVSVVSFLPEFLSLFSFWIGYLIFL